MDKIDNDTKSVLYRIVYRIAIKPNMIMMTFKIIKTKFCTNLELWVSEPS